MLYRKAVKRVVRAAVSERLFSGLLRTRQTAWRVKSRLLAIPASTGEYSSLDPEIVRAYNKVRPQGPNRLVCYVPFSNISFSLEGRVLACDYNQRVELGRYPERSVKEIWLGEPGRKLREYMEHNDLSYGCEHCRYFFVNRCFSMLKPQTYDKYSRARKQRMPKVMEFEVANTCNLQCVMCNGRASSAIRSRREKLPALLNPYDDAFVEQIEEFLPFLEEAKFYGGEPFLIDVYYKIWDRILRVNPAMEMFVITNGTLLNERIKDLLRRGNFEVGVSIDAMSKTVYESIRVGADHDRVMENLHYFNDYCKSRGKVMTISATLMRVNWREIPEIVKFCNRIGAVAYFSYLRKPYELALWNLEKGELEAIERELRTVRFPEDTAITRQNKKAYTDFLQQLRSWKEEGAELEKKGDSVLWQG